MIGLVYRDSLPQGTADELDQLVQGLTGMLYREHDPDGTHTNITAQSLTLDAPNLTNGVLGTIVFQDRLGNKSTISRADGGVSMLTLANGTKFVVKRSDLSGTIYTMAALGLVTYGGSSGNGVAMYGLDADNAPTPTSFHDWAMLSGVSNVSPGARLEIADLTAGISPISLRYRSGVPAYEWMKTTGGSGPTTEQVNLGSGLDSSQQGFWDNLYVKSITLGNGAGPVSAAIGTWADVTFNAANFTAGGAQTWTVVIGNQMTYAYMLVGNTMTVQFIINATTVGGTPDSELRIAVPLGLTITGRSFATIGWGVDAGTVLPVLRIEPTAGNAYISLFRYDGATWAAATLTTSVRGQVSFSIA